MTSDLPNRASNHPQSIFVDDRAAGCHQVFLARTVTVERAAENTSPRDPSRVYRILATGSGSSLVAIYPSRLLFFAHTYLILRHQWHRRVFAPHATISL